MTTGVAYKISMAFFSARVRSLLIILFGFFLFAIVLYTENVIQRIQHGEAAQAAIQQLDAIRYPMLEIKALENRLLNGADFKSNHAALNRLDSEAERILERYLELAQYKPSFYALVKQFANRYAEWEKHEKWLFEQIKPSDNGTQPDLEQQVVADRLLLDTLFVLAKGEAPLHDDIHSGKLAVRVVQVSGLALIVYLFFVIIIFQRSSARVIAAREQNLYTTLHSIGDAVISTDVSGCVQRMNPVAEQLTGWLAAEAKGRPLQEIFIIKSAITNKLIANPVETVLREGRIVGLANHTVLISRDGSRYQIADSAAPIKDKRGAISGVVLVFHDVSAAYDIQRTVAEQAMRLSTIIDSSMDAIIAADDTGKIIEWNAQASNIFGWTSDEIIGAYLHETIIPVCHREAHLAGIERLKNNGKTTIINKRFEILGLHKDGHDFPIELAISQTETKDGYLFSAFIRDLTDIKKAEQELELAAITFDSHSGIIITDSNKRILRVNPAMEEMTGYSAEEMIGEYPRILKSGRQKADFYKEMWRCVNSEGSWSGELWNKKKDGSLYAEFLTITEVKDKLNKVTHYVATSNDISERKNAEEKIEQLAYYDDLTGLANRRLLLDRLKHEIKVASRHKTYGALLFLDLDHFKNLNDSLGHPVGDELLRQVAKRLSELVRSEDTVSRLGGDEFIIMLPATHTDLTIAGNEVSNVADKIKQALNEVFVLDGYQYYLNVSIGLVVFPEALESADDVLKHADSALYLAKEQGRNTSRFYKPQMQKDADARLKLERDIRNALQNNEFVLHYQPQVDVEGNIIGAEALIRWNHPQHGLIFPDQFIQVAEETGLILDIGRWVLEEAIAQISKWHETGICPNSKSLAVNISPLQFHQHHFVDEIIEMINTAGISAGCLELEITENLLMESIGDVVDKLIKLRGLGIKISIDDFGTGYSSLSYLKSLPLDKLKIDRSFVCDLSVDNNDAAIVDTIIAMSKHLGLNVIAEGVETQVQLDFLISKGCEMFQGYFFSKAVSEEQIMNILKNNSFDV